MSTGLDTFLRHRRELLTIPDQLPEVLKTLTQLRESAASPTFRESSCVVPDASFKSHSRNAGSLTIDALDVAWHYGEDECEFNFEGVLSAYKKLNPEFSNISIVMFSDELEWWEKRLTSAEDDVNRDENRYVFQTLTSLPMFKQLPQTPKVPGQTKISKSLYRRSARKAQDLILHCRAMGKGRVMTNDFRLFEELARTSPEMYTYICQHRLLYTFTRTKNVLILSEDS